MSNSGVPDSKRCTIVLVFIKALILQWERLRITGTSGVSPALPLSPRATRSEVGFFVCVLHVFSKLMELWQRQALGSWQWAHIAPVSWSSHRPGWDGLNAQLNKEPLDYNCQRDSLEGKCRLFRGPCGRQTYQHLNRWKAGLAVAGVGRGSEVRGGQRQTMA